MAAARNVSAAARRTVLPSPRVAARELADRRGLAGPIDADDEHDGRRARDRGPRLPVRIALDEECGELGADRGLGAARFAAASGALRRPPWPAPRQRRRR